MKIKAVGLWNKDAKYLESIETWGQGGEWKDKRMARSHLNLAVYYPKTAIVDCIIEVKD